MKAPKNLTQHDIASLQGNMMARNTLTQCEGKSVSQRYVIWDQYLEQLTSMNDLDAARDGFAQAMAERVVPASTKIEVVGHSRNRGADLLKVQHNYLGYWDSHLHIFDVANRKTMSIRLSPSGILELAGRLITLGKHSSKADTL